MKTQSEYLESCLESLSKFSKEELLEELEMFLEAKKEKGESLEYLKDFYLKGGLKQSKH